MLKACSSRIKQSVELRRRTNLDHVELGNAVLLHAHGHGDAVLFDQHVGCGAEQTYRWVRRNPPGRP